MGIKTEKHHHEVAPSQHELGMYFNTLTNQIDHFCDVVKGKVKPKVNGNDGLVSLKIFDAIIKSARTGKKINI